MRGIKQNISTPISISYPYSYLSSNGSLGGSNFACDSELHYQDTYTFFVNGLGYPVDMRLLGTWVTWYYPTPTKITRIVLYDNCLETHSATFKLQASNDYNNWVELYEKQGFGYGGENHEIATDIDTQNNYYSYYRIQLSDISPADFLESGYDYWIDFANIEAQQKDVAVGLKRQTIRKYYKYSISPWTQPVLTSNGLIGGYSMAVASSRAPYSTNDVYRAFDSDTSTRWYPAGTGSSGIPIILTIYNPVAIRITNFMFTNGANANNAPNAFTVYGSNDNTSFTQLGSFTNSVQTSNATWNVDLSSNTGYYQYYKIEFTQWNGAATGGRGVKEIDITATQKTITEGTSSDYDFYEDINAYMAIL